MRSSQDRRRRRGPLLQANAELQAMHLLASLPPAHAHAAAMWILRYVDDHALVARRMSAAIWHAARLPRRSKEKR
jgi:hypothetical protein